MTLMQPSSVPSLDQLKEKYFRSGLWNSRSGLWNSREKTAGDRRYSIEKGTSVSRPTTNSRKLYSENAKIFSKKQNFCDIVLKAAEHKPFLERLNSGSRNRLAGLGHQARLEKFRNIASRWKNKANGRSRIDTLPEVDYEVEMPEEPRFCATLSTEAQYAIFKGYEDVLVDKISSSLSPNEKNVHIKRIPSAAPRTHSNKSSLPLIENQRPNVVLIASSKSSELGSNVKELDGTSARLKRVRNQRYMSAHFKQAMNILDELKRHNSEETAAASKQVEGNTVTAQSNICRQYQAWSRQWAKQFEFSY